LQLGLFLYILHHPQLKQISKLYARFEFNDGIDFTVRELKKVANEVGPLGSKILQGNHAIVRSSGATEKFRQHCQKKSERKPVNAVFLLDGIISVPAARGINGACRQAATSLYHILKRGTRPKTGYRIVSIQECKRELNFLPS
jgi:hypothetical protein